MIHISEPIMIGIVKHVVNKIKKSVFEFLLRLVLIDLQFLNQLL